MHTAEAVMNNDDVDDDADDDDDEDDDDDDDGCVFVTAQFSSRCALRV